MPADSLRNPSDPDAGYSGHKGQGYQVQVVENYSESDDDRQLSLITHVAVESADQHDANALLPAIEALQERGIAPEQLLADSLYGSDTNCRQAMEEHDVTVIAPAMPGNQKNMHLVDFTLDNQGRISPVPGALLLLHSNRPNVVSAQPFHPPLAWNAKSLTSARWKKGKKLAITGIRKRISVLPGEDSMKQVPPSKKNIDTGPGWKRPCLNMTGEPA